MKLVVSKFTSSPVVRSGAKRFLAIVAIPLVLLMLAKVLPSEYFLIATLVLSIVLIVLLSRANKAMNKIRDRMDADENIRRVRAGLPPRRRRRWLRLIFPFYT